jgi:hypothetical protein
MKVFTAKFEGVRPVGKPRKRWEDAVQQDAASFLRCCNWKLAADVEAEDKGGQGPIWAVAPLDGWLTTWRVVGQVSNVLGYVIIFYTYLVRYVLLNTRRS